MKMKDKVHDMYKSGCKRDLIVKITGLHPGTVSSYVNELEKYLFMKSRATAIELLLSLGYTKTEIAAFYGLSRVDSITETQKKWSPGYQTTKVYAKVANKDRIGQYMPGQIIYISPYNDANVIVGYADINQSIPPAILPKAGFTKPNLEILTPCCLNPYYK